MVAARMASFMTRGGSRIVISLAAPWHTLSMWWMVARIAPGLIVDAETQQILCGIWEGQIPVRGFRSPSAVGVVTELAPAVFGARRIIRDGGGQVKD